MGMIDLWSASSMFQYFFNNTIGETGRKSGITGL